MVPPPINARDHSALAAVCDDDLLAGLARLGAERLHLLDHIHACADLAEHHVLPVQPLGLGGAEEELASVGVGASVGHGEDSRPGVLQGEVLVRELVAEDGLASSSVMVGEVTSLAHESRNDPVEGGSLESESLFASAQSPEVLRGVGDHVRSEIHGDPPKGGTVSSNVEKTSAGHLEVSDYGLGRCLDSLL